MNIRELIKHLEEQIAHKNGREPNASWVLNELKKYIEKKDTIGEMILNAESCKSCKWCSMPRNGPHVVNMESVGSFPVCETCFELYLKSDYEQLKSRIKQVRG